MQHVMVPVPEEHLAEFQGDLMRLALGMSGWDDAAVGTLLDAGVEPVLGDLRDRASLRRALAGVAVVYHVGALYRPGRSSRADLFAANLNGTRNLLAAAIRAGVDRFVYCSTIGVHGDVRNPPADETAPFAPGDD